MLNLYKEVFIICNRITNFESLGLGLFIHWGLFSLLEKGEWTELIHNYNKSDYEQLINKFEGNNFNADKIVLAAKDMGARYITLTTKHHEGFCLFNTHGLTDFDITNAPSGRDFVSEFVSACRKYHIIPFFYVASYDWHNPDYTNNFHKYLKYLEASVKVLCTNYGKIGGFWFDGNWNKKDADWELDSLYSLIRRYQPDALIINNTGLKNKGAVSHPEIDVLTYERNIPNSINHMIGNDKKYRAGETCLTMNKHWGWAKNDIHYKSIEEIIVEITSARSKELNVLLNIGLGPTGDIKLMNQAYMNSISTWMGWNSEAIYNIHSTSIRSFSNSKDIIVQNSVNPNVYYALIHDLKINGNDNVLFGGEAPDARRFSSVKKEIKSIKWLDNNELLRFHTDKNMLTIDCTGFSYGNDLIVRVAKIEV